MEILQRNKVTEALPEHATVKHWKWQQPSGALWLVETDPEKGIITMRDQNEKVLLEWKNLKPVSVLLIEESFLSVVAVPVKKTSKSKPQTAIADYNPMYV